MCGYRIQERGAHLNGHHTEVCGREIASTGMFDIKPKERQLHGATPQPVGVTLWGARGCRCLPSVPASAGQTRRRPGRASLAEGLAARAAAPRAACP